MTIIRKVTKRPQHLGTGIYVHSQFITGELVKGDTFFDADYGSMIWSGKKWKQNENYDHPDNSMPIEKLKKGEYFKIVGGTSVLIYEGYCRQNKKYCATYFNDVNKQSYKKKGTLVYTDFEF